MASFTLRNGRWQVRIRRKQSKTITASFANKGEATQWARRVEKDLASRRPSPGRAPGSIPFESVGDLLKAYESRVTVNKKGAYAEARRVAFLRSCSISRVSLEDLRRSHVAAYRDTRRALVRDDTIRRELDILSAAISWARLDFDLDWLVNPVRPVVSTLANPSLNQRDRRPTGPELERLRAEAKLSSSNAGRIIELAIETAMRRSELANLDWEDVDLTQRVIRLRKTKNGTTRDVPLSPAAIRVLAEQQAMVGRVGTVFDMRADSITQVFSRMCVRAGIVGLRFHDLRHEAASRLVELGLSTIEVAAVTGHRSMQMLKRYTQLRAPDLAARIAALRVDRAS